MVPQLPYNATIAETEIPAEAGMSVIGRIWREVGIERCPETKQLREITATELDAYRKTYPQASTTPQANAGAVTHSLQSFANTVDYE